MPEPLPPDLSRLGAELERATERRTRTLRRRAERRRRALATGLAAVAVTVVATFELQDSDRAAPPSGIAAAPVTHYRPVACDQPRGATFAAVRPCASPGATDVQPVVMARRYAVQ